MKNFAKAKSNKNSRYKSHKEIKDKNRLNFITIKEDTKYFGFSKKGSNMNNLEDSGDIIKKKTNNGSRFIRNELEENN